MGPILEAGRIRAGLTHHELWLGYCALGGMADPATLDTYLAGTATPSRLEYDVIAQTLNDFYIGAGTDLPVPYAEDLPQ
jgi:hypothetical protein